MIDPTTPQLKIKKSAQVSVLGYHDFSSGKSTNQMVINVEQFRKQMQGLKDAKLKVISMADYLAWRKGERDIPDPAIMITIDDGWKSVYNLAYPVLKEYGYPFTIFLYKQYVGGGGRALTVPEIKEMMQNGATVGCHSASHPFAPEIKKRSKGLPEEYEAFLQKEFMESKQFLETTFGQKVTTFAYVGGWYTEEMATRSLTEWGYEALFTCKPVRTTWDTPMNEIGRFIIIGNDPTDRWFKAATNFGGGNGEELGKQLLGGEPGPDGQPTGPLVVVKPAENETITDRRPQIEVDLSRLAGIDPATVSMRLPGIGTVPAKFDPKTGKMSYKVVATLRSPECSVHVRLRRKGEAKDDMVSWKFFIDQLPHYLPADAAPAPTVLPALDAPAGAK